MDDTSAVCVGVEEAHAEVPHVLLGGEGKSNCDTA